MLDAEFFRTLFRYNGWANGLVLSKASEVPDTDYYATAPGLSFGSLHATLAHTLVAEIVWLARFQHDLPPEALKDARQLAANEVPTLAALKSLWAAEDTKQERFFATLRDEDVDALLAYQTQAGEPYKQPLRELLLHLLTHGTQFRAEAAVRMTALGRSPGDFDLIVWLRAGNH